MTIIQRDILRIIVGYLQWADAWKFLILSKTIRQDLDHTYMTALAKTARAKYGVALRQDFSITRHTTVYNYPKLYELASRSASLRIILPDFLRLFVPVVVYDVYYRFKTKSGRMIELFSSQNDTIINFLDRSDYMIVRMIDAAADISQYWPAEYIIAARMIVEIDPRIKKTEFIQN